MERKASEIGEHPAGLLQGGDTFSGGEKTEIFGVQRRRLPGAVGARDRLRTG